VKTFELECLKSFASQSQVDSKSALDSLSEISITSSDFESNDARLLFDTLQLAIKSNTNLDVIAISEKTALPKSLVSEVVLTGNPGVMAHRFQILKEASLRRQYSGALRNLHRVVVDSNEPLSNAVAEAARLLSAWQDVTTPVRTMDGTVLTLVDELEAVAMGKRAGTLPSGIEALDASIGGLQPTLTIVGALPGVGKSALVAGICQQLASRAVSVGLLSLEDEAQWLTRRLMSQLSGIPVFVLANKRLHDSQQERVQDAAVRLHAMLAHIHVDDRPGLSTSDVVASARRMIARGAKAIILDHLGEVRIERTDRHDLDISDCLRELRNVAKTTRVPVVVLTHLKRRDGLNVDSEPRLTDFAFSSGVERMARVAIGLWRAPNRSGELNATVLKQTQGVSGITVPLRLNQSAGIVVDSPAPQGLTQIYGNES